MAASTFLRTYNSWYGFAWEKTQVCSEGARRTTLDDRLLVIGDGNPEIMFCLDQRGWIAAPESMSVVRLDELRANGASIILVASNVQDPGVLEWLATRGQPLVRNSRYALLRVQ